jgi:glutamyl/glutaminyl-tRNA synthetase
MSKTRCRFAPSPTGRLHVGGARTALFNYLFAKSTGGNFVLRIEDTDRQRSSLESERGICEDLRWLGLNWQEGPNEGGPGAPYRQSERLELYTRHMQELIDAGRAYYAYETGDELTAERKLAEAAKTSFRYRRRQYSAADLARFKEEGRVPVLRFATPAGQEVLIHDLILGEVRVGPDDLDDFIIGKGDGFPTYHFAVVVDDHHMQVSHVLRAQEHLMNTARHILLYQAFGWEMPEHGHMPVINSIGGGKMSKRDKAKAARTAAKAAGWDAGTLAEKVGITPELAAAFLKKKNNDVEIAIPIAAELGVVLPEIDVEDFRASGFLPEALLNYLALLGWSNGDDREIWDQGELEQAFSVKRIGASAARFDPAKLLWMNGQYVRASSVERLVEASADYIVRNPEGLLAGLDPARLHLVISLFHERFQTFAELEQSASWVQSAPAVYGPEKSIKKHLLKGDGLERLSASEAIVAGIQDWTAAGIEAGLQAAADARYEGRVGKLAQPLRVALTGGPVSPGIGETLAILSQAECVARIQACSAHFAEQA